MNENDYKLIQIDEQVYSIESDMVRSWLFIGHRKALLVDTTNWHADLLSVIRTVTDLPVMLVITHAHQDHIASNDCFETAYMHPDEYDFYAKNSGEGFAKPLPLEEGEIIDLGGQELEVIHIPGHTKGSIALLNRTKRVLVSGDTISAGPVFLFDEAANIADYQNSLLRLKERSADYDSIYTSHGPYCVQSTQIDNQLLCLKECLEGKVAAEEPPFPIPAKMYQAHGAGFFLILE